MPNHWETHERNSTAAGRLTGPRWRAIAYRTTKSALTRLWREETRQDAPKLARFIL